MNFKISKSDKIVLSIIAMLLVMVCYLPFSTDCCRMTPKMITKIQIYSIAVALEKYNNEHGAYPFEDISLAINLSEPNDSTFQAINKLLGYESFTLSKSGLPEDAWGKPIYFIHNSIYTDSPFAEYYSEEGAVKKYYNPVSFQLISFGSDGRKNTKNDLSDDIFNFEPKR